MSTKLNIYQKLLLIQQQVKGLKKDKQSNNYEYVTGNKLLSFIKPLMDEQGLILKQEVLSIDNERMDYKTGIGTQYEKPKSEILSKVMMRFTWIDSETGEKDENLFGANGQNDWEKGLGSALTYAERYFLLKYFHIATDEDDIDNPERKAEELKMQETENLRLNAIEKILSECNTEDELKKQFLSLSKQDQITFTKITNELKEKLTKMLDGVKKSGNYVSLVNNAKNWKASDFSTL